MDRSRAIAHLSVLFPNKSENYLRRQYQLCNYDLTATVLKIENHNRRQNNTSRGFFRSIINGLAALCCCVGLSSSDNFQEESRDNEVTDHDFQSAGPPSHRGHVATIFQRQQEQNQIVNNLVREDEAFARRLQEEQDKFAKAKSIRQIPGLSIKQSGAFAQTNTVVESFDEHDAFATFEHPATFYREEAQVHLKKRSQFYQLAHIHLNIHNRQMANYYFQQAKKETKLIEENNNRAAAAFLAENTGGKKNTIDLHHLYVKEAVEALDIFLDKEILDLMNKNIVSKDLNIITGRGKHSVDGIPKIKPAVIKRLNERSLKHFEINPGHLKVQIAQNSFLTNELI